MEEEIEQKGEFGEKWERIGHFKLLFHFPKSHCLKEQNGCQADIPPFHGFLKLNWKSSWFSIKLFKQESRHKKQQKGCILKPTGSTNLLKIKMKGVSASHFALLLTALQKQADPVFLSICTYQK